MKNVFNFKVGDQVIRSINHNAKQWKSATSLFKVNPSGVFTVSGVSELRGLLSFKEMPNTKWYATNYEHLKCIDLDEDDSDCI